MITTDQPDCFGPDVLAIVSSRDDGTMLDRAMGVHDGSIVSNRTRFCELVGTTYGDTVYQRILYDETQTYAHIEDVGEHSTTRYVSEVAADALYTTSRGIAMMLPVADCVATVVYDPIRKALAVAHLGRHSSYAKLAQKVVAHFVAGGSRPEDLVVWMSPHAGKDSYRLDWFDRGDDPDWRDFYEKRTDGYYLDLAGFNARLFERSGVSVTHISVSNVDTMKDDRYFSHANGDTTGRIALIARMY